MSNPIDLSKAIPINYSDSLYGFSNPSFSDKYHFELLLTSKDNRKLRLKKTETKKYSCILTKEHKIKYNDINHFILSIKNETINEEISDFLDHTSRTYHKKTDNVYIEFYEDYDGYAICTCYYLGNNNNDLFISPPV